LFPATEKGRWPNSKEFSKRFKKKRISQEKYVRRIREEA
jgi:methionine synthase II (cobalamin-independent)